MIETKVETIQIPDTQISEINKQYQKIQSVFEQLTQCIDNNEFGGQLPPVFFNLVYIHDHYFMQEQITLSKYNFEGLDQIKKTHQFFLDEVVKYQLKIEENAELSCKDMSNFMIKWSKDYFELNETAIKFLKNKGV